MRPADLGTRRLAAKNTLHHAEIWPERAAADALHRIGLRVGDARDRRTRFVGFESRGTTSDTVNCSVSVFLDLS
jgi:hypothetical protein